MPFRVYEKATPTVWRVVEREYSIGGRNLLFHLSERLGHPNDRWFAPESLIQQILQGQYARPNQMVVVIETMHYYMTLYEVWGVNYVRPGTNAVDWTPFLLVCKQFEITNPDDWEADEMQVGESNQFCYQFGYLRGETGGWNFGQGIPTSPILFDDTHQWFNKAFR